MTRKILCRTTLFAAIAALTVTAGCDRGSGVAAKPSEPAGQKALPAVYTAEKNGYMNDPEFRRKLDDGRKGMTRALARRTKIAEQMEQVAQKVRDAKGNPFSDAEYLRLKAQLEEADRAFAAAQKAQREQVAERIRRAQADSRRVAEGKARAK